MEATSPVLEAARNFLDIVWNNEPPSDQTLLASVDKLLASYHDMPDPRYKDHDLEAPDKDWKAVYDATAKRFPNHGFYAVAEPLDLDDRSSMMISDAIDDIADITKDMREIVWFAENVSVDVAHWWCRQHYSHWGLHARNLSTYLYARTV